MSVIVKFISGRSCPFFACDVCGKPIHNPGLAWAVWIEPLRDHRPEDAAVVVSHVHKGDCLDIFERNNEVRGVSMMMSDELLDHIDMLASNVAHDLGKIGGAR